jgi:hypothetical protein
LEENPFGIADGPWDDAVVADPGVQEKISVVAHFDLKNWRFKWKKSRKYERFVGAAMGDAVSLPMC